MTLRLHGLAFLCAAVAFGSLPAAYATPGISAEDLDFFEKKVRPLLAEHCYKCHSEKSDKVKGSLLLDSKQGWQIGGDTGPSIIPGQPGKSLFMTAILYEDHDLQMPPKYKMEDGDIAILQDWIARGAPDPRNSTRKFKGLFEPIDVEKGREFWAFKPITNPATPDVKNKNWPVNDIDRFLLKRMEEQNLAPAADADRRTIGRRIYYDLTGLPPTPEELDHFEQDKSADARARLIDRLMATPEFGERWGRHWLDVARYAESSGGGRSLMYKDAWRFRDYVIDSFNQDKPFDQLIREHIAGDLLPADTDEKSNNNLIGAGFLMLGPINYELQDKQLLKMDIVDEQIDTLGRTFMGMTLGCVRCHHHPFDPISSEDYYAMAGIFQSTHTITPGNVSGFTVQKLNRFKKKSKEQVALEDEIHDLSRQLAAAVKNAKRDSIPIENISVSKSSLEGIVVDDTQAKKTGVWKESTFVPFFVGDGYVHSNLKDHGPASIVFDPNIRHGGIYEVRISYSSHGNRPVSVPVIIDHQDGRAVVKVNQVENPDIDDLFVSVGQYRFEADTVSQITISNEGTSGAVIADAVQLIPVNVPALKGKIERPKKKKKSKAPEIKDPVVAELDKKLKELKSALPEEKEEVAMSVYDVDKPADGHIHIRGEARNKGKEVPRAFLRIATPAGAPYPPEIAPGQSGRIELADWIASPDNPLTARVAANRVWHHLTGEGIVRTTDNFGAKGELPSHPELLDYLAARFIADDWSFKKLIRTIMLSRTYGLSSVSSAEARSCDPENRLLSNARRRRLDAESIRDSMLAISGNLDRARGGLTIRKIQTYDMKYKFDTRRRSVYVPAFRNSTLPIFEVFDAANPNLVVGRRTVSTVPTQSLFMMNSQFVFEQAQAVAAKLEGGTPEHRIRDAYRKILGRDPSSGELKLARDYLLSSESSESGNIALCQSLFASIDFRYMH